MIESTIIVVFEESEAKVVPYRIDNETSHRIRFRQNTSVSGNGEKKNYIFDHIKPRQSIPYSWDEPMKTKVLQIEFQQGSKWISKDYKLDVLAPHRRVQLTRTLPDLSNSEFQGYISRKHGSMLESKWVRYYCVVKKRTLFMFRPNERSHGHGHGHVHGRGHGLQHHHKHHQHQHHNTTNNPVPQDEINKLDLLGVIHLGPGSCFSLGGSASMDAVENKTKITQSLEKDASWGKKLTTALQEMADAAVQGNGGLKDDNKAKRNSNTPEYVSKKDKKRVKGVAILLESFLLNELPKGASAGTVAGVGVKEKSGRRARRKTGGRKSVFVKRELDKGLEGVSTVGGNPDGPDRTDGGGGKDGVLRIPSPPPQLPHSPSNLSIRSVASSKPKGHRRTSIVSRRRSLAARASLASVTLSASTSVLTSATLASKMAVKSGAELVDLIIKMKVSEERTGGMSMAQKMFEKGYLKVVGVTNSSSSSSTEDLQSMNKNVENPPANAELTSKEKRIMRKSVNVATNPDGTPSTSNRRKRQSLTPSNRKRAHTRDYLSKSSSSTVGTSAARGANADFFQDSIGVLYILDLPNRDEDVDMAGSKNFELLTAGGNLHKWKCHTHVELRDWVRVLRNASDLASVEFLMSDQTEDSQNNVAEKSELERTSVTSAAAVNVNLSMDELTAKTLINVRVKADGVTKVLELSEEGGMADNFVDKTDESFNRSSTMGIGVGGLDDGLHTLAASKETVKLQLSVELSIGISIIDKPRPYLRELVYLSLRGICVKQVSERVYNASKYLPYILTTH